jgi:hypothetical protein
MRLDLNQFVDSSEGHSSGEQRADERGSTGPIRFGDDARRAGCAGHGEVRCGCGSLLARLVGGEVELKCRRCKQTWTIPLER